jgi:hypothetical protein
MRETMPPKSRRTFSKWFIFVNVALVWALMFASLIYQQAEHVINAGLTLIGCLFSIYAGVGHLDFRNHVKLSIDQLIKGAAK